MADKAVALSENLYMNQIILLMNGKIQADFIVYVLPCWKSNLPVNSQHCFMVPPSQTASAFLMMFICQFYEHSAQCDSFLNDGLFINFHSFLDYCINLCYWTI